MATTRKGITIQSWTDGICGYSIALPTSEVDRFKADMDSFYGQDLAWTDRVDADLMIDSYQGLDADGMIVG
jgi:hypothetical protein